MLPDSKDEFPKLLYLDQNKWIDLSRAHYAHPMGEPFRDALAAVREAVDAGKLIVPFSLVNMMEMSADNRAERRERFARFMVDLSCNRTILPFTQVQSWEIGNALHAFYGLATPGCIRPSIVREGLANALALRFRISGLSPENEAWVLQQANSVENAVEYLVGYGERRESAGQLKLEEIMTLPVQESVRARSAADEITWDQRWAAELGDHLRRGDVGESLVAGLQEIGIPVPAFFDRFTTAGEFRQFFASVHTLEVRLTLTLARDRDLGRRIHPNDSRDLIWLSVALPYSNLVVLEKYWRNHIRSRRLDIQYGTTVITDVCEIPARLAEMGCL